MRDFVDILTTNKYKRLDICKECAKKNKLTFVASLVGLSGHISRVHNMTLKEYVLKYHHYGFHPLCKCGCGKKTSFSAWGACFMDYISGHNYRGHTKENDETVRIRTEKTKKKLKGNPLCSWAMHPEIPEEEKRKIGRKIGRKVRKCAREGRRKPPSKEAIEKGKKTKRENLASGKTIHWTKMKSKEEVHEIMVRANKKAQKTIEKNIKNGKVYHAHNQYKTGWYFSTKNNKWFYYQSSYEEEKFIEFDKDDTIISWRHPAGKRLSYFDTKEKRTRSYFIDFLIEYNDGQKQVVETKGNIDQNALDKAKVFFKYARENNLDAHIYSKNKQNIFYELTLSDIKKIVKNKRGKKV